VSDWALDILSEGGHRGNGGGGGLQKLFLFCGYEEEKGMRERRA